MPAGILPLGKLTLLQARAIVARTSKLLRSIHRPMFLRLCCIKNEDRVPSNSCASDRRRSPGSNREEHLLMFIPDDCCTHTGTYRFPLGNWGKQSLGHQNLEGLIVFIWHFALGIKIQRESPVSVTVIADQAPKGTHLIWRNRTSVDVGHR
jgi:hypothetical protein